MQNCIASLLRGIRAGGRVGRRLGEPTGKRREEEAARDGGGGAARAGGGGGGVARRGVEARGGQAGRREPVGSAPP